MGDAFAGGTGTDNAQDNSTKSLTNENPDSVSSIHRSSAFSRLQSITINRVSFQRSCNQAHTPREALESTKRSRTALAGKLEGPQQPHLHCQCLEYTFRRPTANLQPTTQSISRPELSSWSVAILERGY